MPPIRVYSDAPIHNKTAAKPEGITPQTAQAPTPTSTLPQSVAATTTRDSSGPPPPQPGARSQPPFIPAPTSGLDDLSTIPDPPQPQPGAHPQSVTKTVTETITQRVPPPPQLSYEPPQEGNLPTHSTSTTTNPVPRAGPTTLNMGPVGTRSRGLSAGHSLEHPPNYVQNPYAADGSAVQRNLLHDAAARERADSGVVGVMMEISKDVGESLKTAEEAIWKWVGGKS